jgi:hypothetical protein
MNQGHIAALAELQAELNKGLRQYSLGTIEQSPQQKRTRGHGILKGQNETGPSPGLFDEG